MFSYRTLYLYTVNISLLIIIKKKTTSITKKLNGILPLNTKLPLISRQISPFLFSCHFSLHNYLGGILLFLFTDANIFRP